MPFNPGGGSSSGGGGSVTFYEEGSAVGTGTLLNFVGSGVTATFSGGTAIATVAAGTAGFTFSGARVTNATQSINSSSATTLTWDTEAYDTDAYRDAGAPTQFVIPATGKYRISLGGWFGFSTGSELDIWVSLGTATALSQGIGGQTTTTTTGKHINCSFDYDFTAGGTVIARLYHDNGSARALTLGYFTIARLDP